MRARLLWCYRKAVVCWLPYLVLGGLAGDATVHRAVRWSLFAEGSAAAICLPQIGMFGLISSACPAAGVDLVWYLLLGLPRLCLMVLYFAPAEIIEAAKGSQAPNGVLVAAAALAALGLVALPCALSLRYWSGRSAGLAGGLFGVLAADLFAAIRLTLH